MPNVIRFLCLLFIVVQPLAAQSKSGDDPLRKPGRSVWFACTSKPDDLENPVTVMNDEKLTKLELPEYMASEPVRISEDGIVRIVREVPDPDDPAKTRYLVLAEAKVPEGVRNALIILVPLAKSESGRIFRAKVQDLASFKGGDRLFINLSGADIGVQIGDSKIGIPARKSNMYKAPDLAEPKNMQIIYSFFHPKQGKWKMFSASTVVIRPTRREINVFNDGSRIGNIEKHKILFPIPIEKERGG